MRLLRVIKRGIAVTMLKYLCTRRNLRPVLWNGDKRLFFNFQRGRGNSKEVTLDGFLSPSVQCTLKLRKLWCKKIVSLLGREDRTQTFTGFQNCPLFFFLPLENNKVSNRGKRLSPPFYKPTPRPSRGKGARGKSEILEGNKKKKEKSKSRRLFVAA